MKRLLDNRKGSTVDVPAGSEVTLYRAVSEEGCEEPDQIMISIGIDRNLVTLPRGLNQQIQANLTWGSTEGGITNAIIDCGLGARIAVDAAETLQVVVVNASGGDLVAQCSCVYGTWGGAKNRFTFPTDDAVGGNGGTSADHTVPPFAKTVTILTNVPPTFPETQLFLVKFWTNAADKAAGDPALFVSSSTGPIEIPEGATVFNVVNEASVAARLTAVCDLGI
jgi:hypothetical protein